MQKVIHVLIKIMSRYLSPEEFKLFYREISDYKNLSGAPFVEIMQKHFDIATWYKSPQMKHDYLLYNYFTFEYLEKAREIENMFVG